MPDASFSFRVVPDPAAEHRGASVVRTGLWGKILRISSGTLICNESGTYSDFYSFYSIFAAKTQTVWQPGAEARRKSPEDLGLMVGPRR